MKLRYIFATVAVAALTFVSCSDDYEVKNLKGIELSSSYIGLPADGGSTTITVKTNDTWQLDTTGTVTSGTPWLRFSSLNGSAGESDLTVSADAVKGNRSATIKLISGDQSQIINIIQQGGEVEVKNSTVAEVLAGADGTTYRVTGTVTGIAQTYYGNFYLNDGTGELYIYGTVNSGGSYAWSSFNIEVGDEVTVQGPRSTYGSTVELVDATWITTNKSLIKCDSTYVDGVNSNTLPIEGGEITAYLTCKGQGISSVDIPDDAKSWLSISNFNTSGTAPTVTFKATENVGGDRSATVVFHTTDGTKDYSAQTTINQKGAIIAATLAEFRNAEVGQTQYRLNVLVTRLDNRGNYYVNDYSDPSGEVEIYKPTGDLASSVKAGDVITVVGTRAVFRSTIEMANPTVEAVNPATSVTLADFNAAEDGSALMMITGTVKDIVNAQYGNIHVTDGTTDVYVYGVYGYGAPRGADRQNFLSTNNIEVGDQITLVGPKTTYRSTIEMNGGYYLSHTKATSEAKRR